MVTGDVADVFRHVPFNCWFCGYLSGYFPELDLIVVNLCLIFDWTGSPVHYSIAGQVIKTIQNSRPGFQNLVYCDDHILIGDSRRFETQVSGIALRRAMVTVLGTTACNEKKFTTWQRQWKALGLIFDFDSQTVSKPASKIAKVVGRLLALLDATKVTLRQLRETMGLLRYLGTCIPVAKLFYNRLQAFLCPRGGIGSAAIQSNQLEDIRWLLALFRSDALQFIYIWRDLPSLSHRIASIWMPRTREYAECDTARRTSLQYNGTITRRSAFGGSRRRLTVPLVLNQVVVPGAWRNPSRVWQKPPMEIPGRKLPG